MLCVTCATLGICRPPGPLRQPDADDRPLARPARGQRRARLRRRLADGSAAGALLVGLSS